MSLYKLAAVLAHFCGPSWKLDCGGSDDGVPQPFGRGSHPVDRNPSRHDAGRSR